jgi:hypothetical protein
MTKKELLKVHPTYTDFLDEWKFFINSYLGGKFYRDGDYLLKHPFESPDNYKRRKDIAYFYNYCAPIIDLFTSYLTKDQPKRSYGALSSDVVPPRQPKTLFDSFWWDVDFEGTNFEQFMRDAQRYASVYGMISIIVDKPTVKVKTKADALTQDIRPYLSIITPENILDWKYIRLPNGKMALDMIKIHEGDGMYRIWTRLGWEAWEVIGKDKAPVSRGRGVHGLGRVPIVDLYNKKSLKRRVGVSEIQDIADINKNIYYFCSDAKEIIENTAFPMLAQAEEKGGGPDEPLAVGTSNIISFDADAPNGKPFWLEPPHSSLQEIREWIQQDAQEMVRIAKMGGLRNTETSVQPWSGVSIEAQERQLYSSLAEKASNAEQAELDILKLYAEWEEEEFTGNIEYSRSFATRDLTTSLTNAVQAGTAKVESLTFEKERHKKIVDATTPGLEETVRDQIFKEIDEMTKLWWKKDLNKVTPLVSNPAEPEVIINNGGEGVQDV